METGGCLCGKIRFTFSGSVNWSGYCHCASCRRNCAAPVTAFIGVPKGAFRWAGDAPAAYRSSDHATRFFCDRCGTPMAYASTKYPDEIHLYTASLDRPEAHPPTTQYHLDERIAWLPDLMPTPVIRRALPDYPHWPALLEIVKDAFAYMEHVTGAPPRAKAFTPEDLAQRAALGAAWVVEANGPQGCLFARPSRDLPDALFLHLLALAPAYRGQGLAGRLVQKAEAEARAQGYRRITLDTGSGLTELRQTYQRWGWTEIADTGEDVTFVRDLPPLTKETSDDR